MTYVVLPPQPMLQSASLPSVAPLIKVLPQKHCTLSNKTFNDCSPRIWKEVTNLNSRPAKVKFWSAHEAMQPSTVRALLSGSWVPKTRPCAPSLQNNEQPQNECENVDLHIASSVFPRSRDVPRVDDKHWCPSAAATTTTWLCGSMRKGPCEVVNLIIMLVQESHNKK